MNGYNILGFEPWPHQTLDILWTIYFGIPTLLGNSHPINDWYTLAWRWIVNQVLTCMCLMKIIVDNPRQLWSTPYQVFCFGVVKVCMFVGCWWPQSCICKDKSKYTNFLEFMTLRVLRLWNRNGQMDHVLLQDSWLWLTFGQICIYALKFMICFKSDSAKIRGLGLLCAYMDLILNLLTNARWR